MSGARVVVDPTTIRPSKGPCTGVIWIELGPTPYPLQGWNDFSVVILVAFAEALLRLLQGSSSRERVHFMEGPYAVDISMLSSGSIKIRTANRGLQGGATAEADEMAHAFTESVLAASDAVVAACRDTNCWSPDADKLEHLLPRLREAAARLRN
jgi:hypothetical protein